MITIIVPVYNVEEHLSKCIESLLSQTYRNIEIILVDDGSTDKSGQICVSYSLKDNRIKLVRQNNEGAAMARNAGYKVSSGQYVFFIDGDDYIDYNTIQILYESLIKHDSDIVLGQFCDDYDGHIFIPQRAVYGVFDKDGIVEILKTNYLFDYKTQIAGVQTGLCSRLYKREILENVLEKGKNLWIGEDAICNLNIITKAKKIVILHDVLYYYVRHKKEATMKPPEKLWSGYVDFWKEIRLFDKNDYFKDQLPLRMAFYTNRIIYNSFYSFSSCLSYISFLKKMRHEPIVDLMINNRYVNTYYCKDFYYKCFRDNFFFLIYLRLRISHTLVYRKIRSLIKQKL